MAIELYKSLLIPVFSFSLFTNEQKADINENKTVHPLHLATVEIDNHATEETLEITCKTFWDDFESILSKVNKSKVDLSGSKDTVGNNKKIFVDLIKLSLQEYNKLNYLYYRIFYDCIYNSWNK